VLLAFSGIETGDPVQKTFRVGGDDIRCSVSSIPAHSSAEISTTFSPRWRVIGIGARSATALSITVFRFSGASE
jgi:hypothetical protein